MQKITSRCKDALASYQQQILESLQDKLVFSNETLIHLSNHLQEQLEFQAEVISEIQSCTESLRSKVTLLQKAPPPTRDKLR